MRKLTKLCDLQQKKTNSHMQRRSIILPWSSFSNFHIRKVKFDLFTCVSWFVQFKYSLLHQWCFRTVYFLPLVQILGSWPNFSDPSSPLINYGVVCLRRDYCCCRLPYMELSESLLLWKPIILCIQICQNWLTDSFKTNTYIEFTIF